MADHNDNVIARPLRQANMAEHIDNQQWQAMVTSLSSVSGHSDRPVPIYIGSPYYQTKVIATATMGSDRPK